MAPVPPSPEPNGPRAAYTTGPLASGALTFAFLGAQIAISTFLDSSLRSAKEFTVLSTMVVLDASLLGALSTWAAWGAAWAWGRLRGRPRTPGFGWSLRAAIYLLLAYYWGGWLLALYLVPDSALLPGVLARAGLLTAVALTALAAVGRMGTPGAPLPRRLLQGYLATLLLAFPTAFLWIGYYREGLYRADASAPTMARSTGGARRAALVLIDGGSWKLLDPMIRAGRLPHLGRMAREGAAGTLRAVWPYKTMKCAYDIATGTASERHGVVGYVTLKLPGLPRFILAAEESYLQYAYLGLPFLATGSIDLDTVTAEFLRKPAIWETVSDAGGEVCVLAWPASYPARPVRGTMVSDRAFYSTWEVFYEHDAADPRNIRTDADRQRILSLVREPGSLTDAEIRRVLAPNEADLALLRSREFSLTNKPSLTIFSRAYAADLSVMAMADELLERSRPELFACFLEGFDDIAHTTWGHRFPEHADRSIGRRPPADEIARYGQALDRYLELIDAFVGTLMERMGPENAVIVVSDHGSGGPFNRLTNEWDHDGEGIFLAWGRNVLPGARPKEAWGRDVAPTVLRLLGYPVARDMDGRMLEEILEPSWR